MADPPLVLPFTDPRCREVALSGGKGASLATMIASGLRVPPGFVVTSAAFFAAIDESELRAMARAGEFARVRSTVTASQLPVDLIGQHYAALGGLVAVRSSACAEDSVRASYAGVQETYLNVGSLDAVLKAIVECWLSFFSERAVFYREEKGSLEDVAMAVVVQEMVNSRKSGVLFTVDPVQGRRDRMVVEAAFGLGEAVVSGNVTPDHYVLDLEGVVKRSRVVDHPVLDERECRRLAQLGRHVVDIYGSAQDIEWAIDGAGALMVLQSRPVTTV